jgi:tetratricopeptide (TPR) repeat protein
LFFVVTERTVVRDAVGDICLMSDNYESIRDALKENQPTKALEHAQALAAHEPDNPSPPRIVIEILNKLGRYQDADEYAATVLTKYADPLLHLSFAAGAAQAGKWEEADRRFSQVVSQFPDFPAAYNAWFSAFVTRGDVTSGEQLLAPVVGKFAGDVWILHNWALAAVLRGDFRTAKSQFVFQSMSQPFMKLRVATFIFENLPPLMLLGLL